MKNLLTALLASTTLLSVPANANQQMYQVTDDTYFYEGNEYRFTDDITNLGNGYISVLTTHYQLDGVTPNFFYMGHVRCIGDTAHSYAFSMTRPDETYFDSYEEKANDICKWHND